MIEEVKNKIFASEKFLKINDVVKELQTNQPLFLNGIYGSLLAFVCVNIFNSTQKQFLIIVPDKDTAEKLRDDCSFLVEESCIHLFVASPAHSAKLLDMSAPIAMMESLRALNSNENVLLVASAEAISTKLPTQNNFNDRILSIEINKEYPFENFIEKLIELDFTKKDFVEEYGDFAVRGGIIDVFPFVGDNPIRIEFWGDNVESIREFDVESQRSIRELNKASIVAQIKEKNDNSDFERNQCSIFEYLKKDALVFLYEPELIEKEILELINEGYENIYDWSDLTLKQDNFKKIIHSNIKTHNCVIEIGGKAQPVFGGSIKRFIEHINSLSENAIDVYISSDSKDGAKRLNELVEEELTKPVTSLENNDTILQEQNVPNTYTEDNSLVSSNYSPINYKILDVAFHSGFIYESVKVAILTEHQIFGRIKKRGSVKRKKFKGFTQKDIQQLYRGDYVVHQDYGIGQFAGLQKIKVCNVDTEVMKLIYQNNDTLYVNLNYINRVKKYSSQEGHLPKLSKLGGAEWEKLKLRTRKKIKDIARDLIKLYARRKHEKGFAFATDTHWQKEMEASFMYEDTPDQMQSTIDVKKDMEQDSPMDRLICGDVGFGKTEIAVRASFKAVMNGKQVAVLVPTTILAQQHFSTFVSRLEKYSVRIETLSRFKTPKEQKQIVEDIKKGKVDIVIGTHRVLSKDVEFKNLGLLIIDEEQRFGVTAKEKLRQMQANIDTLTLTATPIPRTLQFSLMGARDLSLITTPPINRIPIHTEILTFDPKVLKEIIMKELFRGGQVFFVHDRINNIENIKNTLEQHIPKARFQIAHGQMSTRALENTMMDFMNHKFDVLICTKIIESGIDMPNANTIIINRADMFGLAELYQLRGRVGRSNVQAYAYLITPPLHLLTRQTLRRLQAIQEFTELGSGFNLAMRDLEIRGAGNLLGGEQSGFILEMGFEMYQKIVEEAVAELKEEEFSDLQNTIRKNVTNKTETIIETDIEAIIPDIYIEKDSERLDIYRRLYGSNEVADIKEMRNEIKDRFGDYPEEVENLFKTVELKIIANKIGFVKVELKEDDLLLYFPDKENNDFYEGDKSVFQKIVMNVQKKNQTMQFIQDGNKLKLKIKLIDISNSVDKLENAKFIVNSLSL